VAGLSQSWRRAVMNDLRAQDHLRQEVVDGVRLYRVPCIRKQAQLYHAGGQALPRRRHAHDHRLLDKHRYDVAHAHFIPPTASWPTGEAVLRAAVYHRPRTTSLA
jgi:hypothetical protein